MAKNRETEYSKDEIISLLVMLFAQMPRPPTNDDADRLLGLLRSVNKEFEHNLCEVFAHIFQPERVEKDDAIWVIRQFIAKNVRLVKPPQVCSYVAFILKIGKESEEFVALQETVERLMAGSTSKRSREKALEEMDKRVQELDMLANKIMQGHQAIGQKRIELEEVYHQIDQLKADIENAERDAIATEILSQEKFEAASARREQAETRLREAEAAEAAAFRQMESAEERIVVANSATEGGRLRDSRLISQALSEVGIIFPDNESLAVMADEVNENNAVIVARQLVNDLLRGVISRLTYETRELATVREDLVDKSKELAGLRVSHAKVMQDIRSVESELSSLFADLSSRRSILKQKQDEKLAVVAECDMETAAMQKAIVEARNRMAKAKEALQTTLQDEIAAAMSTLKQHSPSS